MVRHRFVINLRVLSALFAMLLLRSVPILADTVVQTATSWDGGSGVGSFTSNGSFATVGQTFTVPVGDSRLARFSFYVDANAGMVFRGELYAWNGLYAISPALYESAPMHTRQPSTFGYEEVGFYPPFGVQLTPGAQYVFFLTTSRDQDGVLYHNGFLGDTGNAYAGGTYVNLDNNGDVSAWTSTNWNSAAVTDLAFRALFKSPLPVPGDFDGDGEPDIVFRNYSTGQNAVWIMNGTRYVRTVDLPPLPDTNWRLEGAADFNGDGKPDLVFRNYVTGQNAIWLMNGTALMQVVDLPAVSNLSFRIEAVGDLNNDGTPDILFRNHSTGQNVVWIMSGTSLVTVKDLPGLSNSAVQIVGTGDFDGDGKTDIVFRNYATGANAIWRMNGTTFLGVTDLPALTDTNFKFQAVSSYKLTGRPDIVLRNQADGRNAIWVMNFASLSSIVDLPVLPITSYEIAGPR